MANKGTKSANPQRVYWDSCVFLDYLNGNHRLHEQMQMVMDDWKAGKLTLVTSALTIAEVMYVKCDPDGGVRSPAKERRAELAELFDPPVSQPFVVVELHRALAQSARQINWDLNVRPKDAVHLASAVEGKADVLQTTDLRLVNLMKGAGGLPGLRIELPSWTRQLEVDPNVEPGKFSSLVETSGTEPPAAQSPAAPLD